MECIETSQLTHHASTNADSCLDYETLPIYEYRIVSSQVAAVISVVAVAMIGQGIISSLANACKLRTQSVGFN
jgi:hypothetical protein